MMMGVLAATPITMHEFKEYYLHNHVTKAANPVKINFGGYARTIGSSFQIKFKGKRFTITNNHVCSVMKRVKNARNNPIARKLEDHLAGLNLIMKGLTKDNPLYIRISKIREDVTKRIEELAEDVDIIGESMVIGDMNRKITYLSENHDICILEPLGGKYLRLASGYNIGESVMIIGHPRGLQQSISDGRLVNETFENFPWLPKAGRVKALLSTAVSYPGNSGSPVVNKFGNVVGILFAGYNLNFVNLNIVVPLDALRAELEVFVGR
jgi:hypothetical protein